MRQTRKSSLFSCLPAFQIQKINLEGRKAGTDQEAGRKSIDRKKTVGRKIAGRIIGGRASTDFADYTDFQRVNEENRKAGTECSFFFCPVFFCPRRRNRSAVRRHSFAAPLFLPS
jgi:hypothetical protein